MILPSEWHYLGLVAISGVLAVSNGVPLPQGKAWVVFCAFLVWMVGRSCFGTYPSGPGEPERGVLGALLLLLLGCVVRKSAEDEQIWKWVAVGMGVVGASTAAVSAFMSCIVLPPGTVGERLTNLFVHGGLNAVCTGVSYGCAALWLITNHEKTKSAKWVWIATWMLQYAVLLTRSRGALLALAAGLVVWVLYKRDWKPVKLLLLAAVIWVMPQWLPQSREEIRPAVEMAQRADAGRFLLYETAWATRGSVWIGTGQWGVTEAWMKKLPPDPNRLTTHFHSGYLATFIHGGVLGLGLLLSLMAIAALRAWKLAREGQAQYLALLVYGWTAVLFDGQSLASLTTSPRYEGLVFWLPMLMSLAKRTKQETV
ncbi:MAG: O-antigen ligase family protein [Verrucomicrobiaceae bacterium]|nr:O-antigen ligase family protein [Verrucomicrobiaceae bacterium]